MSEPLRIDTHIHLYSSRQEGEWWKAGYEIWEYGQRDGVDFSQDTGTLGETVAALGRGVWWYPYDRDSSRAARALAELRSVRDVDRERALREGSMALVRLAGRSLRSARRR